MSEGDRAFGYVGALDGLRALAVAAVLVFHADIGVADGGFLGVSVFFTLSGFLITSLLMGEHERTGSIGLRGFYVRRARRLLPAAYACIAAVLLLGPSWVATQRRDLPGDVVAAVANVANWRFAFAERTYQDLFIGAPSPLAHFWSLAIEEQCYLVLPMVVAWSLGRGGTRRLGWVLGSLAAASLGATLLTSNLDLIYNGTHTRAAELLVGALAAVLVQRRSFGQRTSTAMATVGLVGLGLLVALVDLQSRWLYRGGFVAVAGVSACTVVALVSSRPVARLLGGRPFVAVGRRSYGLYLYHWPVFLVLTPERIGFSGWSLFLVRLVVTAMFVALSYRVLEMPVRQGVRLTSSRTATVALATVAGALVVAALTVVPKPVFDRTEVLLALGDDEPVEFTLPTTQAPPPHRVVLVVGSSSVPVSALRSEGYEVVDGTDPRCPVVPGVEVQLPGGTVVDTSLCAAATDRWPELLRSTRPDAIVLAGGPLDLGMVRTGAQVGFPSADDLVAVAERLAFTETGIRAAIALLRGEDVPVLLYREPTGIDPLRLDEVFGHAAVARGEAMPVHRTTASLVTALAVRLDAGVGDPDPMRILVVGDSTSLDLAQALSDGGEGRVAVLWAGANGCPFVRAEARRTSADVPWGDHACPDFAETVPPLLASFRPDAVVVVAGPTELSEQRYPGDPGGHVAGDPSFVAFHDAEMAAFLDVVGDVPVRIADAVPIRPGRWATAEMAAPDRLVAWQAQIDRWDAMSTQVSVFPYAAALAAYEAVHGDIRTDGVHPDVGPLTDIARDVLVPALLASVAG